MLICGRFLSTLEHDCYLCNNQIIALSLIGYELLSAMAYGLSADEPLGMLVEHSKNSSHVLLASRVVLTAYNQRNSWSIA